MESLDLSSSESDSENNSADSCCSQSEGWTTEDEDETVAPEKTRSVAANHSTLRSVTASEREASQESVLGPGSSQTKSADSQREGKTSQSERDKSVANHMVRSMANDNTWRSLNFQENNPGPFPAATN